jgi:hypothetical protein
MRFYVSAPIFLPIRLNFKKSFAANPRSHRKILRSQFAWYEPLTSAAKDLFKKFGPK